jgi:hypothetical protein
VVSGNCVGAWETDYSLAQKEKKSLIPTRWIKPAQTRFGKNEEGSSEVKWAGSISGFRGCALQVVLYEKK